MTDQSPWLFPEDVETLTGKKRHSAQIRALKDMQIKFIVNHVGRPLVERSTVLKDTRTQAKKMTEPNWSALGG